MRWRPIPRWEANLKMSPFSGGAVGEKFMNDNKDAFDPWWESAEKPLDSPLTIDAAIHDAVMALPPDERRDRAKVN